MLAMAVVLAVCPCWAQGPAAGTNHEAGNNAIREALPFVQVAAVVADRVRHRSLNNYTGVYISEDNWSWASQDDYIGPFLRVKFAKPRPERSAACVFSPDKEIALCVYFDGHTPFGLTTIRVGVSGHVEPHRVALSYEGLANKLLKNSEQKLDFTPMPLTSDDGRTLPGFQLKKK